MGDDNSGSEPKQHYSEESFWAKLGKYALAAGKVVVEKALSLYYCAVDPATPAWAKSIIFRALAYFIVPLDAIADLIPAAGYTDDLDIQMTSECCHLLSPP